MPRRAAPPPTRVHLLLAAVGWTVFVVYGSLVPLRYHPTSFADAWERFSHLPPLWFGMGARADWVANILLFIPLTALFLGAVTLGRGTVSRVLTGAVLVPLAAAAATALEFVQIWFPGRTVSRNDIVAEITGGILGVLLWLGIGEQVVAWLRTYTSDRRSSSQLTWLLQAYLLGFIVYAVMPLDLTISVTELYHKYQRGQVQLLPFGYAYESLFEAIYQSVADVALMAPAGAYWALRRPDSSAQSRVVGGMLAGLVFAGGVEFVQLLVMSRYTDVTDVLLGTVGAALGAWLVTRAGSLTDPPRTQVTASAPSAAWPQVLLWLTIIAAYSLVLIAGFWYPFELRSDGQPVSAKVSELLNIPFYALYRGTEFNAIRQVLLRVLLFAPIGVVWALIANLSPSAALRRVVLVSSQGYAAALSLGIELGQMFMPGKVADLTEVFLSLAGSIAGTMIAARMLRGRQEQAGKPVSPAAR